MEEQPVAAVPAGKHGWGGPWPLVGAGLGLAVVAVVLHGIGWAAALAPLRVLVLLGAPVVAGVGVRLALKRLKPDLESRLETASVVAVASLVPLLAFFGTDQDWDSLQMVYTVLILVSVFGAFLVLLPWSGVLRFRVMSRSIPLPLNRRFVISVLVLVHFAGILTAVTSVPPPGLTGPWISSQLWTHFYRPYLGFFYLNNAYHFYSPEPGPPTLMWSYATYKDKNSDKRRGMWIKLPDRDKSPVPLHHQRLLAMTESINVILPQVSDAFLNAKLTARKNAGLQLHERMQKELEKKLGVRITLPNLGALHPNMPLVQQCRLPADSAIRMSSSYARHLCRVYPTLPDDPDFKIETVKVYRVIHSIIEPSDMAQGSTNPEEKTLYFPYFHGEFKPNGDLVNKDDPFLYCLIPILREKPVSSRDAEPVLLDYLDIHARFGFEAAAPAEKADKKNVEK